MADPKQGWSGKERREDYSEWIRKCQSCEKKCASHEDKIAQIRELLAFKTSMVEATTEMATKLGLLEDIPQEVTELKTNMEQMIGLPAQVSLLKGAGYFLAVVLAVGVGAISTLHAELNDRSDVIVQAKDHISAHPARDTKMQQQSEDIAVLKKDMNDLKKTVESQDVKLDKILERLPKKGSGE